MRHDLTKIPSDIDSLELTDLPHVYSTTDHSKVVSLHVEQVDEAADEHVVVVRTRDGERVLRVTEGQEVPLRVYAVLDELSADWRGWPKGTSTNVLRLRVYRWR